MPTCDITCCSSISTASSSRVHNDLVQSTADQRSGWYCPQCKILWETEARQGEARHRVATKGYCRPVPVAGVAYHLSRSAAREIRGPGPCREEGAHSEPDTPVAPATDWWDGTPSVADMRAIGQAVVTDSDVARTEGAQTVSAPSASHPACMNQDHQPEVTGDNCGPGPELVSLLNFSPITMLGAAGSEESMKLMDVAVGLRLLSQRRAAALLQAIADPAIQRILAQHRTPRSLFKAVSSNCETTPWQTVDAGVASGVCQKYGFKQSTIMFRYKDPVAESRCLARAAARLGYHLHTRPILPGENGDEGHPMQGEKAAEIWSAIQRFSLAYGLGGCHLGFLMVLLWSDGTFVGRQGWVNGEQARISIQNAPLEFIRSDCGSRMVAIFPHVKAKGEMSEHDLRAAKAQVARTCWVLLLSELSKVGPRAPAPSPDESSGASTASALAEGRFEQDPALARLLGMPEDAAMTVALGVFQADMKEIWDRLGLTHKRPVHVVVPERRQGDPALLRALLYVQGQDLSIPPSMGCLRTSALQQEHVRKLALAQGTERGKRSRRDVIRIECGQSEPYINLFDRMPWGRYRVVVESEVGDDTMEPQGLQDGMEAVSSSDLLHEFYKGLLEHLLMKVKAYTECSLHQHHKLSKTRAADAWSTVTDRMRSWGRDCLSGADIQIPSDLTRQLSQTNGEELKGISRVLGGALSGICRNENVIRLVYLFQLCSYERESTVFTRTELEDQSRHIVAFCLGLGSLHKQLTGGTPQIPKMVQAALSTWDALRHGSVAYRNMMVLEKTQADLKEGLGAGPRNMPTKCSEVAAEFVDFLQQHKLVAHCRARQRTLQLLTELDPATFSHIHPEGGCHRVGRILSPVNIGTAPPVLELECLSDVDPTDRLQVQLQRENAVKQASVVPAQAFRVRRTCSGKHGKGFKLWLGDFISAQDNFDSPMHGVLRMGYGLHGRDGRSFRQVPGALIREARCNGLVVECRSTGGTELRADPEAFISILPQASRFDLRDPTCPGSPITIKGHPAIGLKGHREHYCSEPQFVLIDNSAAGVEYNRLYVGKTLVIARMHGRTSQDWRADVHDRVQDMLRRPQHYVQCKLQRARRTMRAGLQLERNPALDLAEDYQVAVDEWAQRVGVSSKAPKVVDQYYVVIHKYDEVWGGPQHRCNEGLASPVGHKLWEPSYLHNHKPRVQAVPLGAVVGKAPMFYAFEGSTTVRASSGRVYMFSMASNSCPVPQPPWLRAFVDEVIRDPDHAMFGSEAPLAVDGDSTVVGSGIQDEDVDAPPPPQPKRRQRARDLL